MNEKRPLTKQKTILIILTLAQLSCSTMRTFGLKNLCVFECSYSTERFYPFSGTVEAGRTTIKTKYIGGFEIDTSLHLGQNPNLIEFIMFSLFYIPYGLFILVSITGQVIAKYIIIPTYKVTERVVDHSFSIGTDIALLPISAFELDAIALGLKDKPLYLDKNSIPYKTAFLEEQKEVLEIIKDYKIILSYINKKNNIQLKKAIIEKDILKIDRTLAKHAYHHNYYGIPLSDDKADPNNEILKSFFTVPPKRQIHKTLALVNIYENWIKNDILILAYAKIKDDKEFKEKYLYSLFDSGASILWEKPIMEAVYNSGHHDFGKYFHALPFEKSKGLTEAKFFQLMETIKEENLGGWWSTLLWNAISLNYIKAAEYLLKHKPPSVLSPVCKVIAIDSMFWVQKLVPDHFQADDVCIYTDEAPLKFIIHKNTDANYLRGQRKYIKFLLKSGAKLSNIIDYFLEKAMDAFRDDSEMLDLLEKAK